MEKSNDNNNLKLKLLGPVAESAGRTLQDAWELAFGGFGNYVDKKRESRRKDLESFKALLEDKVNNIPSGQLCEPPLYIVGPSLDASKYYFEEAEIRKMFASLIASSMDSRVSSRIHPSYSGIIQQMSALDAQNLKCLFSADGALPIGEYQVKMIDPTDEDKDFLLVKPHTVAQTNVFLSNPSTSKISLNAASMASLLRLGLISIDYERSLTDFDYSIFEKTAEYQHLLNQFSGNAENVPFMQKGVVLMTPLGEDFCTICLPTGNT